jgi:alpha,alpha-trehalase
VPSSAPDPPRSRIEGRKRKETGRLRLRFWKDREVTGLPVLDLSRIHAVIFDMDGVVTDTASVHAAAWKRLFDEYLTERSRRTGEPFRPFDVDEDYRHYVDGKPRYDGVRSFLASRGISLPEGDPSDPPERETVCGLGNRKNGYFLAHLKEQGADAYASTVTLVRDLQARGVRAAVISASRNMAEVLASAGLSDLFGTKVDGVDADELGLSGKPDPAIFLEAARRLGVEPARAAVVEDALAGVEAGRGGRFGLVIGVDRTGHSGALREAGADVVVRDLGEVTVGEPAGGPPVPVIRDLPSALQRLREIAAALEGRTPAVFLDYDGTLTPIVDRPEDAILPEEARRAIEHLAARCPVAVVSGRDLDDVRALVGVGGISYAGSHGFDILAPGGSRHQKAREHLPALEAAETELRPALDAIPGARLERKRFAIALHYREVSGDHAGEVEAAVDRAAARHPELRKTGGKKVFELRPAIDWDKGKAVRWLLEVLGLDGMDVLPLYIGDDETDEDAFRAVRNRGLGIVVRGESDERPTAARYQLGRPAEVARFLDELASLMGVTAS